MGRHRTSTGHSWIRFSFTVREEEGIKSLQQQPIDYSRKWYVMAAVAMGIFLAAIDGSIVNIALPTLVRELRTDFAIVQWVVLAYLMTVTTLTLSVGRLADMLGKKRVYTSGFVVFTIWHLLVFHPIHNQFGTRIAKLA